jgi:O-Antigen ligase
MREPSTVGSRPGGSAGPGAARRPRRPPEPAAAGERGRPLLDPARWTPRHRYALCAALTVAILAGLVKSVQAGPLIGGVEGVRAFLAAAVAAALAWLALSLRGACLPGFLVGAVFVVAGMLSWTYTDTPIVVWVPLGLAGGLFAIWGFPWLRDLARLPRLGAAWLGLAYWLIGIAGAMLVWRPQVAAQRLAYAGVFTLAAIAVVAATRRSRRDLTVGIVAAFLLALALLYLVGSGNAFNTLHPVPDNAWGAHMQYRFWGATGLLYHPNSIAVVAVVIAIRIGPDASFERWQRYAALAAATVTLVLVNSRTGVLYLGVAAVLHALLVLRQRYRLRRAGVAAPDGTEVYRSARAAAAAVLVPILAVGVVGIGSGGAAFVTANRYSSGGTGTDVTSGRRATWAAVLDEFRAAPVIDKVFGDTTNARATVTRVETGANDRARPKLTTDNSAVGALRRGGVLGLLAYLVGLGLLIRHAVRPAPPPAPARPSWFVLAAVGSLATIPFADWLLGGTGGTLWIFLLAGEAALVFRPDRPAVFRPDRPAVFRPDRPAVFRPDRPAVFRPDRPAVFRPDRPAPAAGREGGDQGVAR